MGSAKKATTVPPRFGIKETTVEVDGKEFRLRALKVRELQELVDKYEDDEDALTAALIARSSVDGELENVTAAELDEWPVHAFQAINGAVKSINNLGGAGSGNS